MPEPLRPVPGASTAAETDALAAALREKSPNDGRIEALDRFLEAYPASRWAPVIHLNLGKFSYETGYFQDALAHWKAGWELAKSGEDGVSKDVANLALAESAKMNARIGRFAELEALLAEAQKRTLMGDARVKIASASEGAWMMRHRPGISFRCGPYAVLNVAKEQSPDIGKKESAFLEKTQSPMTGFSIPEVHRMSAELGLKLQIAKREVGAPVIVPAVVHWKLGHFGAVVREADGTFLLKDPTFGNDTVITAKALDKEASGYFLVPAGPLPPGWSRATVAETAQLYGKGNTGAVDDATSDSDHQVGGSCQSKGLAMASYRFHTLATSVYIEDTPVGYSAAFGPDVRVRVTYSPRRGGEPTVMDYTNFGPGFQSNWGLRATNAWRLKLGPVGAPYEVPIPGKHNVNPQFGESVTELPLGKSIERFPDGTQRYYEHQTAPPDVEEHGAFLSRVVDPQGNEATVEYDSTYPTRIHQVVDATGLPTEFHYDYPNEPYLVTKVDDPYGRSATFAYAPIAGKVRLQSTQDPYGIVSSFAYNEAGEIVAMTTPYGTTTFVVSDPYVHTGIGLIRYVEATDPLGQKERLELNIGNTQGEFGPTANVPASLEAPRPELAVINFSDSYNNYRNSFYWDKLLMQLAPGDYKKAHLYHWLHNASNPNSIAGVLESEVPPLEGRIFYNYQGPQSVVTAGALALPSAVGRVVKDGAEYKTQASKFAYNTYAKVTKATDPVGRETTIDYATNGIDVVAIKQRTGTSGGAPVYTTLSTFAYAAGTSPHRPSSVTDAAGKTTVYTYTPAGQLQTVQNPKGEVTTVTYATDPASAAYGRVLSITGAVPGGNRSFTYDAYGRVRTATDADGYVLTFDYDSLDRLRTATYPDGSFEQVEYEDHSLVGTKDREGRWTRHMYNPLMQRVVTQDPALRTTQFQWCRCSDLKRFVDGNGNVTEWQRDEGRHVTKKILPDGSFHSYAYELSGRLLSEVDPLGRTTTYQYYKDDRLEKKVYGSTSTPDVTYTYDAYFPRVATRQDGTGTTTFAYHPYGTSTNGAGNVALVNGPLANDTLKHTYDELGRLKKFEVVDDVTQSIASYSEEYTFDSRSRVSAVQNNLGYTTYAYVGQSDRPSIVNYPNGMQSLFDYFGATGEFLVKQIKHLSAANPTRTVISQFDYGYRQDRSIDTWTSSQAGVATTWTFGYDGARQLTRAERRDASQTVLESLYYAYDKAGNRIQVGSGTTAPNNYEVNNTNQLLSQRDHGRTTFAGTVNEPATVKVNGKSAKVMSTDGGAPFKFEGVVDLDAGANTVVVEAKDGQNNVATKTYAVPTTGTSKTYEYDANGNLRYEKLPNGTVLREYRWDQQNRLVKELHGTHESAYEYDGASRRVKITEKENGTQTKQETFVWCGSRICQKRASNGTTVVRSYFGGGFEESGPTKYFYTRDHLGSVREVVGSDGTTVALRLSYDPWGKSTETGSGALSDFTYTGHYYDRATGVNLAQYRAYDAGLGRWISRDPMGLAGGLNLYGYANNSPVQYIDPDGKHPILWGIGILAFIITYGTTFASDDAAIQAQAHPAAHNSPLLGGLMSIGVVAPLGGVAGMCGGGGAVVSSGAGGAASRVLHASQLGELGTQEGTVVLGHYSRPLMGGIQETLPILENAAHQLGGRTLSSLPGEMSAIAPELESASRIVFYTSPGMQGLTAAEMAMIQSNPTLLAKTTFIYGGF